MRIRGSITAFTLLSLFIVFTSINSANSLTTDDNILKNVYSKVKDSVVKISSYDPLLGLRTGSGFIYDKDGHIITNHHIVAGSTDIDVIFPDGTMSTATYLGSDKECEPAIIKLDDISNINLNPISIGNSTQLNVGDRVYALGNPFGLSGEIVQGFITATGRSILPDEAGINFAFPLYDIIQTDIPINLENYGGPLVNTNGELVGLNTKFSELTAVYSNSGFAVPLTTIQKIVPSLISNGHYVHPWLGISGTDMSSVIKQFTGVEQSSGFYVLSVFDNSSASKAGIKSGDTIINIDNKKVLNLDDITAYIQKYKDVGDNVKLTILRNNEKIEIDILLDSRPMIIHTLNQLPAIY